MHLRSELEQRNSRCYNLYYKIISFIIIRWMLEQIENGLLIQETKMNTLQAIQFITKSWDEITAESIRNCWHHTKILPNANRMEIDITIDDLSELVNTLHFSDLMEVDEFLFIPEENSDV